MSIHVSSTRRKPAGESLPLYIKKLCFILTLALVSANILTIGCKPSAIKEDVPTPVKDTQSRDQVNIPNTPAGLKVKNHLTIMYGLATYCKSICRYER